MKKQILIQTPPEVKKGNIFTKNVKTFVLEMSNKSNLEFTKQRKQSELCKEYINQTLFSRDSEQKKTS